MAAEFLANDEPWPAMTAALKRPNRRPARIAIGFVASTAPDVLPLKRGDVLVCDASRRAVKLGVTDPKALEHYRRKGVRIHSCEGLHAKVIVLGRTAWIGSANASLSSRHRLTEATVQLTDGPAVHQARDWIDDLAASAPELGATDLRDLLRLRPNREFGWPTRPTGIELPKSAKRLHLIRLDERVTDSEVRAVEATRSAAKSNVRRIGAPESALDWFIREGSRVFRPADWMIDVAPQNHSFYPRQIVKTSKIGNAKYAVWTLDSNTQCRSTRAKLLETADPRDEFDGFEMLITSSTTIRKTFALFGVRPL